MQYEFRGKSIHEAVGQALNQRHENIEKKLYEQASAWAPPAFWGPWADVVAQFGVSGPNSDTHVTKINISMSGLGSSPFDYEIKGGDRFISGTAVGLKSASADENITITGNVATQISVRCKSIGLGQQVRIVAS